MPLYTKIAPAGIDRNIQKKQEMLWTRLAILWGLQPEDYISYGRCYRNQSAIGYIPEMYKGGTEYEQLLIDDRVKVTSFFGSETERIAPGKTAATAPGHIIFIVDLTKLGKTTLHRPDEEVRQEVFNILKNNTELQVTEIITGIDRVFSEYSGWRASAGGVNYTDMHPKHCFRLNFTATFVPDNSCLPVFK